MPDPLVLPLELWTQCVGYAIDGQQAGPLEFLGVSKRWGRALVNTPSLWTQIYVQNGEDEATRISIFVHLSKECQLHIDVMTALPTMDGLQLIVDHIARVTTISIRPSVADVATASSMNRWKQEASHILTKLISDGPLDVQYSSCSGISLREDNDPYYRITLIHIKMAAREHSKQQVVARAGVSVSASPETWEEHVAGIIQTAAKQGAFDRGSPMDSHADLACYPRYHNAIRLAIPCFVKLLKESRYPVQRATIELFIKYAFHANLREALGPAIPTLMKVLESASLSTRLSTVLLLQKFSEYDDLREDLGIAIPSLIKAHEQRFFEARSPSIHLLGELTKYADLREVLGLAIPVLVELLEQKNSDVSLDAVSLLRKLAEYDDLREELRPAIPSLIKVLDSEYWGARSVAASLLGELTRYGELREALNLALPSLTKLNEQRVAPSVPLLQLTTPSPQGRSHPRDSPQIQYASDMYHVRFSDVT